MIRIFIGFDAKETVAYHVLSHSILARASVPVSITPLNRANMESFYTRPRGEYDSTDFSNSRFLVPFLCDYQGWAIFMDCDMLCLGDMAEFVGYAIDHYGTSVRCVQHNYTPKEDTKFLGAVQTRYKMKNWSSVMLFNNKMCQRLTLDYVNTTAGLDLHQFKWTEENRVRELPSGWNHLVGEDNQTSNPKLIHFTKGTPCFQGYSEQPYADLWWKEWGEMTSCASPAKHDQGAPSHA